MTPYKVLGYYNPTRWRAWKVAKDILKILEPYGLVPIKDPHHRHQTKAAWCNKDLCAYVRRRTVMNPKAASWHQDGDLDGGMMDNSLVLWTSNTPTQLKVGNQIYVPKAREIILFRNLSCYHRRPPDAPRVRWLFRQRVEIYGPNRVRRKKMMSSTERWANTFTNVRITRLENKSMSYRKGSKSLKEGHAALTVALRGRTILKDGKVPRTCIVHKENTQSKQEQKPHGKSIRNHPKCKRPADSPYRTSWQCRCVWCSGYLS